MPEFRPSKWSVKTDFTSQYPPSVSEIDPLSMKAKPNCVLVCRIETQPMEPEESQYPDDPHPFSKLDVWDKNSDILNGVYEEIVADNEVTRGILELIQHPERLFRACGTQDWQKYRALLIRILDILWD